METAASYTEAKIKTYGFETRLNQCLCQLRLTPDVFLALRRWYGEGDGPAISFEMVAMLPVDDDGYRLSLVIADRHRQQFQQIIAGTTPSLAPIDMQVTAPVELLYFFGPHYGDRFGIAEAAFNVLAENNLPLIAACCSSASVFLVLPEHVAATAKAVFTERFDIPRTIRRPSFLSPAPAMQPVSGGTDS